MKVWKKNAVKFIFVIWVPCSACSLSQFCVSSPSARLNTQGWLSNSLAKALFGIGTTNLLKTKSWKESKFKIKMNDWIQNKIFDSRKQTNTMAFIDFEFHFEFHFVTRKFYLRCDAEHSVLGEFALKIVWTQKNYFKKSSNKNIIFRVGNVK